MVGAGETGFWVVGTVATEFSTGFAAAVGMMALVREFGEFGLGETGDE